LGPSVTNLSPIRHLFFAKIVLVAPVNLNTVAGVEMTGTEQLLKASATGNYNASGWTRARAHGAVSTTGEHP
jgi:hypothetical protein